MPSRVRTKILFKAKLTEIYFSDSQLPGACRDVWILFHHFVQTGVEKLAVVEKIHHAAAVAPIPRQIGLLELHFAFRRLQQFVSVFVLWSLSSFMVDSAFHRLLL